MDAGPRPRVTGRIRECALKITIDIWDQEDFKIATTAAEMVLNRHSELLNREQPGDPPFHPVALMSEEVADAIEAISTAKEEAIADVVAMGAVVVPTVEECVKYAKDAIAGGNMAAVISFLADKKVKRVPDLSAEDRAAFVGMLSALDA